ncbi:MAG: DUF1796 family putative cysteine peptidase [Saprospiraceae bacterium]
MPSLKILVWAIHESHDYMRQMTSSFFDTAELYDIKPELFGIGHQFKEHKQRLWILYDYLKKIDPNTVILCMDGADTLFNDGSLSILQKFLDKKTRILISAEKAFTYQYEEFRINFDSLKSEYRYVNAGTFIGYAGDLLEMLQDIFEYNKTYSSANDQGLLGIWAHENLHDENIVQLDTGCDIFWVTTYDWSVLENIANHDNIIFNPNTKSRPGIIHNVGNNDATNNRAFTAALNNILAKEKNKQCRVFILSPLVEDPEYNLWIKKENEYDEREPIWYQKKHPYVSMFFYGTSKNQGSEKIINTSYIEEAIHLLTSQYYVDYIVHIPKGYYFEINQLYRFISNEFDSQKEIKGSDSPRTESFIFFNESYYPFREIQNIIEYSTAKLDDIVESDLVLSQDRPLSKYLSQKPNSPFDVISLGGWCGPAIALNNMGIRVEAGPFCMIHSTIECLIQVSNGEISPYFEVEKNTLFPHHDIQDPEVLSKMKERLNKYVTRLKDPKPILFVRTIISNNHEESFQNMIDFMDLLRKKHNRKDRLLLLLHDQKIGTVKVKMLTSRIMVWAAEGNVGWHVPNRERIFQNYAKAIEYCLEDNHWKNDIPQIKSHLIVNHHSSELGKSLFEPINEGDLKW